MSHVEMNIYVPSDLKHSWLCTRSRKETMESFHITYLLFLPLVRQAVYVIYTTWVLVHSEAH